MVVDGQKAAAWDELVSDDTSHDVVVRGEGQFQVADVGFQMFDVRQ